MSYVSNFNINDNIIKVKDTEGRELIQNLRTDLNSEIGSMNDKFSKLASRFTNYINVVSDYGADNTGKTDSTINLQKAFNNINALIYFPPGLYVISDSIKINSNTYVFGHNNVVISNNTSNNSFINNSSGSTGGFSANNNIIIENISFLTSNLTHTNVAFGHCSDIFIINCSFASNTGTQNWHLLEINSCSNVWIDRCTFEGTSQFKTEMLQLDVSTSSDVFPWFGPYDNTDCDNIKITNCTFKHPARYDYSTLTSRDAAIGNHNGGERPVISNVFISNCNFNHVKSAFKFQCLINSVITNNIVYDCMSGFAYLSNHVIRNVKITNNYFSGNRYDYTEKQTNTVLGRGISISNAMGQNCSNNIITNNIVENFATHGIACTGNYTIVANNNVNNCGHYGIYADYDNYKSDYHDNIAYSNFLLDTETCDFFVSHTQTSNVINAGGNDIHDNKCGKMRCAMFTEKMLKSRVYNNVYDSIIYPTSFNRLNVYGNTNFNGNPNYYYNKLTLTADNTVNYKWNEGPYFTADHTCYAAITLTVKIDSNFNGEFVAQIKDYDGLIICYQTCVSNTNTSRNGVTVTTIAKVLTGHKIGALLYFESGGGVIGHAEITATELPIPLENTD